MMCFYQFTYIRYSLLLCIYIYLYIHTLHITTSLPLQRSLVTFFCVHPGWRGLSPFCVGVQICRGRFFGVESRPVSAPLGMLAPNGPGERRGRWRPLNVMFCGWGFLDERCKSNAYPSHTCFTYVCIYIFIPIIYTISIQNIWLVGYVPIIQQSVY